MIELLVGLLLFTGLGSVLLVGMAFDNKSEDRCLQIPAAILSVPMVGVFLVTLWFVIRHVI